MLTTHDIKFLNRPTINIFLTAINRSNGDNHSHEYITSLKLSHSLQTLFDEYGDIKKNDGRKKDKRFRF